MAVHVRQHHDPHGLGREEHQNRGDVMQDMSSASRAIGVSDCLALGVDPE